MRPAVAPLAAMVAGVLLAAWPALAAERASATALAVLRAWAWPVRETAPVVLVVIDPPSLAHPAFSGSPRSAWHAGVAAIVERALEGGATGVGIDLVWPRADTGAAWLRALRRARDDGRIVLGAVAGAGDAVPSRAQRLAAGGIDALAAVNVVADADGIVRRMPARIGGLPTLAAALAHRAGVPAGRAAWLVGGAAPALTIVSAGAALDCAPPVFAGRSVLVGAWLPFEDRHPTPLDRLPRAARTFEVAGCDGTLYVAAPGRGTPGVLVHALALASWQAGPPARTLPRLLEFVLLAGFAGIAARTTMRERAVPVALAAVAWTGASALALPMVVLPWLGGLAAMLAGFSSARIAHAAWSARELAATLPRSFRRAPHRARTRELTACFIDIASFTAATEAIADPARVAQELSACLARLESLVVAHGGHVDKYLGDGLLALFGVGDGPDRAVEAARACLAACEGPRGLRYGGRPLSLRIGLARGAARVGPLGKARLHFTAVGDPVNLAARLEQLNKALGSTVLADAAVAAAAPAAGWRDRGEHAVRGRRKPVRVFELTSYSECL